MKLLIKFNLNSQAFIARVKFWEYLTKHRLEVLKLALEGLGIKQIARGNKRSGLRHKWLTEPYNAGFVVPSLPPACCDLIAILFIYPKFVGC